MTPRRQDGCGEPIHVGFDEGRCNQRQPQYEVPAPLRSAREADVIRLQLRHGGTRKLVALLQRAAPEVTMT
jgi:hypothetical protein